METLFRWSGKCLHDFSTNLFRKGCTKFRQHRPSFFKKDITKTFWSIFPDTQCKIVVVVVVVVKRLWAWVYYYVLKLLHGCWNVVSR